MHVVFALEQIEGAREDFLLATNEVDEATESFFDLLEDAVVTREQTERLAVRLNSELIEAARRLHTALDTLLTELQIEQELYVEDLPVMSIIPVYEGIIDTAMILLTWLLHPQRHETIVWVAPETKALWVVPKHLPQLLDKHLFKKELPVIFTSATLSNEGDFGYFIRTLGLKRVSHSTIGSPFDIENQVTVYLPPKAELAADAELTEVLDNMLKQNGGRTLILTNTLEEVGRIRQLLQGVELPFEMLWEDEADRGYLIRQFKENEASVLVGSTFWEGIDVPGEALTQLIIWSYLSQH